MSNNIREIGNRCTGCRACELTCPEQCIRMEYDDEGFLYPVTGEDACVQCGLCRKSCHVLTPPARREDEKDGVYGWNRDESVRRNSSSGGAYSAIIHSFGSDTAFGAVHDLDAAKVRHMSLMSSAAGPQRKSKYVFSDLENCYREAEKKLQEGQRVVFSGTPCQISGLYAYLKQDYETLITVDLICHGVPSMKVLNGHLDAVSAKKNIERVDFRPKAYGWSRHALLIDFDERRHYLKDEIEDEYLYAFLGNYSLRKCCYDCQYSNGGHRADITLADFWGIRQMDPAYNDEKGLSLMIFNTRKGKDLLPALQESMHLYPLERQHYAYVYTEHCYDKKKRRKYFTKFKTGGYTNAAMYVRRITRTRKVLHHLKRALLEAVK